MIRVTPIPDDFTPLERYALALLLDGSGLLQVADPPLPSLNWSSTQGRAPLQAAGWRLQTATSRSPAPSSPGSALSPALSRSKTRPAADRHRRVPSSVNAQVVAGTATEPTVNLLAAALRAAATQAAGNRPFALLSPLFGRSVTTAPSPASNNFQEATALLSLRDVIYALALSRV